MTPEYIITFVDGTEERVKAYTVEFQNTHVTFSNTTLVAAFRSETVARVSRLV